MLMSSALETTKKLSLIVMSVKKLERTLSR